MSPSQGLREKALLGQHAQGEVEKVLAIGLVKQKIDEISPETCNGKEFPVTVDRCVQINLKPIEEHSETDDSSCVPAESGLMETRTRTVKRFPCWVQPCVILPSHNNNGLENRFLLREV